MLLLLLLFRFGLRRRPRCVVRCDRNAACGPEVTGMHEKCGLLFSLPTETSMAGDVTRVYLVSVRHISNMISFLGSRDAYSFRLGPASV